MGLVHKNIPKFSTAGNTEYRPVSPSGTAFHRVGTSGNVFQQGTRVPQPPSMAQASTSYVPQPPSMAQASTSYVPQPPSMAQASTSYVPQPSHVTRAPTTYVAPQLIPRTQCAPVQPARRCGPAHPECYKNPNVEPRSQADCADNCTFVRGTANRRAICRVGAPAAPRTSASSSARTSRTSQASGKVKLPKNLECYRVYPDNTIHYPPMSEADCAEGCRFVPATDKHGAYCVKRRGAGCHKVQTTVACPAVAGPSSTATRPQVVQSEMHPEVQAWLQAQYERDAIMKSQEGVAQARKSRK